MTRRRLWTLTLAACAAIVVAGTPALRAPLVAAGRRAIVSERELGARVAPLVAARVAPLLARVRALPAPSPADLCLGAGALALLVALALRIAARRDTPARRVRRLARRGLSPAAIARRTGLPQDLVRTLAAEAAAPGGRKFRPAAASAAPAAPSFADVLDRTAVGTTV